MDAFEYAHTHAELPQVFSRKSLGIKMQRLIRKLPQWSGGAGKDPDEGVTVELYRPEVCKRHSEVQ